MSPKANKFTETLSTTTLSVAVLITLRNTTVCANNATRHAPYVPTILTGACTISPIDGFLCSDVDDDDVDDDEAESPPSFVAVAVD